MEFIKNFIVNIKNFCFSSNDKKNLEEKKYFEEDNLMFLTKKRMLSKHNYYKRKRNTYIYNSTIIFKNNFQKDKYYSNNKSCNRINFIRESYKKRNKILKFQSVIENSEIKDGCLHEEDPNVINCSLNVNRISFKEK